MQNDFTRRRLFGSSRTNNSTLAGHSLVTISKTERVPAARVHDDGVITRYQKLSPQQFQRQQEELNGLVNQAMMSLDNALAVMINGIKEPKKLDKNAFKKLLFDKQEHDLFELERIYYERKKKVSQCICVRCGKLKFSTHSYCDTCSKELCDFPMTYTKRVSRQIYSIFSRTWQYVEEAAQSARIFFWRYQNPEGVRMHADTLFDIESGILALTPRWIRL